MRTLGLALLLAGAVAPGASPGSGGVTPGNAGRTGPEGSAGPSARRAQASEAQPARGGGPFKKPSSVPLDFRGPGRDVPEPDVPEVLLGWFGPGDPDHPEFGELWRGAVVALEAENAAGGYRGKHFRLEAVWSESPWKAGIVDLARLVLDRGAWAVVGGVDGTATHLAVQVALKSHFLLLSPGSTDVSTDHANVPWLFSLAPSDDAIAGLLADAIASRAAGGSTLAIASSTDHDSHAALVALRRALDGRGLGPAAVVELPEEDADPAAAAAQLLGARPATLVVLARAPLAGRLVPAIRGAGYTGTILGGPGLSRAAFARAAGPTAEGVVSPLLAGAGQGDASFRAAYRARWHEAPDGAAALGYDGVRLVTAAVRRAGLNRPLIRDAVREIAPWAGTSGPVRWDPRGRNLRAPSLGRWKARQLVPSD